MSRCYPGLPGRLRHAAARILSKHLGHWVDATAVWPVQGYWRSAPDADCYRWEIHLHDPSDPYLCKYPLGCWETLTVFVRDGKKYGIGIDWEDGTICSNESEAAAKANLEKPR